MNQGQTLKVGASGNEVRRLQRVLVMMKLLDYQEIDGIFGNKTEQAVRAFQSNNGLSVDGIVGPATWSALPSDPGTVELRLGSSGAVVEALQRGLVKFGGKSTATDPGAIDGSFGSKTEAAVKAYQSGHGITADGVVGDRTWWVPVGGAGATLASLSGLTTV